ncbi:MAG: 50S ribosomal protein L6 [Patescibacteria group bacterium]|nr:50S ribosomal protein L6 [Patescibacteria group bacterium]MDE2116686.1 50S ribosomal protein L6 [Patescibacteria group bacterium]
MSRVAKKPITIPEKTAVAVNGQTVSVKGPLGELSRDFKPGVGFAVEGNAVTVTLYRPEDYMLWGTYASHLKNMIEGVNKGFVKKLIVEGIGFKSDVKGAKLELALGFSHPISVEIPKDLKVTADKNVITISGVSNERVGEFAAKVRALKKPEPYKGKGIRYDTEVIRRKQGKKAA